MKKGKLKSKRRARAKAPTKVKALKSKSKSKPSKTKSKTKSTKVKAKVKSLKSKSKPKPSKTKSKTKSMSKKVKETEVTAKREARTSLNNPNLYRAYTTLLKIIKQNYVSSTIKEKSVRGSAITFWADRAKVVLSANSKEVRLYYALGMKKRYRESPESEGTVVFSHSSDLLTAGVQSEMSEYLQDIFTKYATVIDSEDAETPIATTATEVVNEMFKDEEENQEDEDEDEDGEDDE